jgi:hypothetical protein
VTGCGLSNCSVFKNLATPHSFDAAPSTRRVEINEDMTMMNRRNGITTLSGS